MVCWDSDRPEDDWEFVRLSVFFILPTNFVDLLKKCFISSPWFDYERAYCIRAKIQETGAFQQHEEDQDVESQRYDSSLVWEVASFEKA